MNAGTMAPMVTDDESQFFVVYPRSFLRSSAFIRDRQFALSERRSRNGGSGQDAQRVLAVSIRGSFVLDSRPFAIEAVHSVQTTVSRRTNRRSIVFLNDQSSFCPKISML